MELVIILCLVIVIILLLQEKIVIRGKQVDKSQNVEPGHNRPGIMGQTKPVRSLAAPGITASSLTQELDHAPSASDITNAINHVKSIQVPQEELDKVFSDGSNIDLDEEEEEWNSNAEPNGEDGFATGVTFEELSTVGTLLQQDKPEPLLQKRAVDIIQKIHGTELLSLLENSMEDASQIIASLLDSSLSPEADAGSPNLQSKDLDDFDIKEFA